MRKLQSILVSILLILVFPVGAQNVGGKAKIGGKATLGGGGVILHQASPIGNVSSVNFSSQSVITLTLAQTTNSGHAFVGMVASNVQISSVTDGGDTFSQTNIGGNQPGMFYTCSLSSGVTALTITLSGSSTGIAAGDEMAGIITSSCYDIGQQNGYANSTTFTSNATATSAQKYEVAFGGLTDFSFGGAITPVASGYTTRANIYYTPSGANALSTQYQNFNNGPAAYTYSGTSTNNSNNAAIFLFKLQ